MRLKALAIETQVSFALTVYVEQVLSIHRFPLVGNSEQYAFRPLPISNQDVAIPWDRDIEVQVSPLLIAYTVPLQLGVGVGVGVILSY